jgi:hypothetical protein
MIKFQIQELIKMASHHCTLIECLEEERTFLVPACYTDCMCPLTVLRAVFIVVPESLASFISTHPCATCLGVLSLPACTMYVLWC